MGTSYLPTRESLLRDWVTGFSGQVSAQAVALGILPAESTQLASLTTSFLNCYDAAHESATRTHQAVVAKDVAKAVLLAYVRMIVKKLQANIAVTAEQKAALKITIADRTPTPVPPPITRPVLAAVYSRGNILTLRVRDEAAPDKRARPWGTAGVEVYVFFGENPTAPLQDGWMPLALESKTSFDVTFDAADAGKKATLVARWFSERCDFGPFSDQLPVQVPGALQQAA